MLVILLCSDTRAVHEHGLDRRSVPAHRHAQHPAHVLPAVRREGRARTPVAAGWYQDRHLSQQVGFTTDTCHSRLVLGRTPVAAGQYQDKHLSQQVSGSTDTCRSRLVVAVAAGWY